MELRIFTVAWMQKESLLSTVSENWTLIFKSRKSEKPCMDYWAKKIRKIAPKHVQNTFGHFWKRLRAVFEFCCFFDCSENFRRLDHPWNTGQKNFFKKIAPKHVQNTFEYFCERFWAFLDFWIFSKTRTSMEHWGIFFRKKMPQNTFGHLRTILDSFRTLKPSWFFSWIFSKYLPRILSPENRFQIVLVQKTEHIFLSSGIWTHNPKSRKSEMGLRILTVAWMQKECLLSIVS